ncbi:MAG: GNAT family N-acetyltransferase [Methanosarcinaceae archaeon]|nr:GNAT family N-acetyltransferase [Methanosarcinaceae archaeon]
MKIPVSIKTERLLIRRYVSEDLEDLYHFFNNREITRYTDMPPSQTYGETKAFLDMLIDSYDSDEPVFAMAVCKRAEGEVIGSCGFASAEFLPETQIYYAISPDFQGQGYASEATEKLVEYMFLVLDIERISVYCSSANPASVNVARKIGMEHQGTVKQNGREAEHFLLTRKRYLSGKKKSF